QDPLAIVEKRKAQRQEVLVEGAVVDNENGKPLPARIYIRGADGAWYFPKSASLTGSAIRYERQNGANKNFVEMHTTLSAHPFHVELLPGRYTVTVEHGKEYFPETREIVVTRDFPKVEFRM